MLQSAFEQDDSFSRPLKNHFCPAKAAHLEKRWRCACPCVFRQLVPPVCSVALTASFSMTVGWKSPELSSPGGSTVVRLGRAAGMLSSKPHAGTFIPLHCPLCHPCRGTRRRCSTQFLGDYISQQLPTVTACSGDSAATPFHAPIFQAGEGLKKEAGLPIWQGLFSV